MYCTKKISFIGCLLLVLIGFSSPLKAISGAELAYECLGTNRYKITLQVYRNCSDPTLANSQTIDFSSSLCGTGANLVLTLDSSYEISGIHNTQIANSICNGGTLPGFELFVYSDTLTFSQTCSDWIVSWTGCCRSSSITNLNTSGSGIYVEALIDSRYLYSSPSFERDKLPYYYSDSSVTNQLKLATAYPSGMDGFIMTLTCPLQGANNCVNYTTGLSATQPFQTASNAAFNVDQLRKQIGFVAEHGIDQIATVAKTIEQIKNGTVVGYVKNEFPVVLADSATVNSYNRPVQISDPLVTQGSTPLFDLFNLRACSGESMIFSFVAHDPDGDTVYLDYSNLNQIFGAGNWTTIVNSSSGGFRHDSVQFFVQITPSFRNVLFSPLISNNRQYIRLGLTDGKAPFPSCRYLDLNLSVYQAKFETIPTLCANATSQIQLNAIYEGLHSLNASSFRWKQIHGPPVVFSDTAIPNPIITTTPSIHGNSILLEVTVMTTPDSISGVVCFSPTELMLFYDSTGYCNYPYDNILEGKILVDTNNNCYPDSTEPRYQSNIVFSFEKGIHKIYGISNGQYDYQVGLDTGEYIVRPQMPNAPYWEMCLDSQLIIIDTLVNPQTLDWSIEPLFYCPKLEVDIQAHTNLRACISRPVWVTYRNTGTLEATNAYVEIELDSFLTISNSSIPFVNLGNNLYRFDLDTVPESRIGHFSMSIQASCSTPINTAYTIEAHIYPDSICTGLIPNLVIEDSCGLDSVVFNVTNYADAHTAPLTYWILENATIVDTGFIQLGTGQGLSILYPTDTNKVYQLVIDPYHANYAASSYNYCTILDSNFVAPAILYIPNNQLDYRSTIHRRIIGSYDPNIKTAVPEGYGAAHNILPNIPIDYTIQFQNTGTDTAYQVVILDTLSALFDIGSIQMKGSSHPYTWQFKPYNAVGLHVLEIRFDPIWLVDSTTNEPASHGFVEYSIQQQPNLPNGTVLENSASIYFDSNAPIKTNTTLHTVCDNCYPMQITNNSIITTVIGDQEPQILTKVYPNPTSGWLTIEQPKAQKATIDVYTINGVLLKSLTIEDQLHSLDMQRLSAGTYLIRVVSPESSELFKVIRQ